MSEWRVWKSRPVDLWWALENAPHEGHPERCSCRSFNTWTDAMSYVKGYMGAAS